MSGVFLRTLNSQWIQLEKNASYSYDSIVEELKTFHGLQAASIPIKFYNGCQEIAAGASFPWPENDVFINTSIGLAGGKGGFGSMLRAIGAQIEKTTNREACRDLSGRRLRDINEEKRLKDWVAKQAEREREREERKQKKLEKLKRLESDFKHEFHDPEYFKTRSEITDKVHEALEQGISATSSSTAEEPIQKKRKVDDAPVLKKTALWVGVSDDESELDSDEEDKGQRSITSDDNSQSQSSDASEKNGESQSSADSTSEQRSAEDSTSSKLSSVPPSEPTDDRATQGEGIELKGATAPPQETEKIEPEPAPKTEEKPLQIAEPTVFEPIVLENYTSSQELEALGLNHLKFELQNRGMKCGGTLAERAARLFSVRGSLPGQIDTSLLAKPSKKK